MSRWLLPALAVCAGATGITAATERGIADAKSLAPVASIVLPGVVGRIDHMAFDPTRQRLYVVALGNNTLEVVDL